MFKQITVQELNTQLENNKVKVLDVREKFELNICSINNSTKRLLSISANLISRWFELIKISEDIYFSCKRIVSNYNTYRLLKLIVTYLLII